MVLFPDTQQKVIYEIWEKSGGANITEFDMKLKKKILM